MFTHVPPRGRTILVAQLMLMFSATCASGAESDAATAVRSRSTGGHANGQFVGSWDGNGDDKVSLAEYDTARVQRFAATDTDRNGSLSLAEYVNEYAARLNVQIADERKASIQQTDTRFRALDKNKDNFIDRAEYDASGVRAFQHLDPDGNGRISERDRQSRAAGGAGGRPRSVIRMPTTHGLAGFIEIYDTDGDGEVTREQFDAQRASSFTATDTAGDGKLDLSEYHKEFVARLDRQIDLRRHDQLKQGGVRFKSIDNDKNGVISREEYLAMSTRVFERTDTNKDGVVSSDDPAPPKRDRDEERSTVSAAERGTRGESSKL